MPSGRAPRRALFSRVPAPVGAPGPARVRGKTVVVEHTPAQRELADSVRTAFADAGADVRLDGVADITVSLSAFDSADEPVAPQIFELIKAARGVVVVAARAEAEHAIGLG